MKKSLTPLIMETYQLHVERLTPGERGTDGFEYYDRSSTTPVNVAIAAMPPRNVPLSVSDPDQRVLVFSDEFNKKVLDTTKWRVLGTADDGRYHEDNVDFRDGKLALRVDRFGDEIRAGRIDTKGIFEQRYGVFEVRAKLDEIQDTLIAFWLNAYPGVSSVGNGGRDGAEVDIVETAYRSSVVIHTIHWDGYGRAHRMASSMKVTLPFDIHEGFHVYGMEWTPDTLTFFVDGMPTVLYEGIGVPRVPEVVIISTEYLTRLAQGNIKKAKLPLEYEVDWIRVYERPDEAGPQQGGAEL